MVGGKAIRRQAIRRAKVTEEDLDWSEKSREIFETALDKGTEYTKAALVGIFLEKGIKLYHFRMLGILRMTNQP